MVLSPGSGCDIKIGCGGIDFRQSRSSPDVRASSRANHRAHRVPSSSVKRLAVVTCTTESSCGAVVSLDVTQDMSDTATGSMSSFGVLPSRWPGVSCILGRK